MKDNRWSRRLLNLCSLHKERIIEKVEIWDTEFCKLGQCREKRSERRHGKSWVSPQSCNGGCCAATIDKEDEVAH